MATAVRWERDSRAGASDRPETERLLAAVREAARTMQFGHILIKVQDGRVVQVEKTEKVRFE